MRIAFILLEDAKRSMTQQQQQQQQRHNVMKREKKKNEWNKNRGVSNRFTLRLILLRVCFVYKSVLFTCVFSVYNAIKLGTDSFQFLIHLHMLVYSMCSCCLAESSMHPRAHKKNVCNTR